MVFFSLASFILSCSRKRVKTDPTLHDAMLPLRAFTSHYLKISILPLQNDTFLFLLTTFTIHLTSYFLFYNTPY